MKYPYSELNPFPHATLACDAWNVRDTRVCAFDSGRVPFDFVEVAGCRFQGYCFELRVFGPTVEGAGDVEVSSFPVSKQPPRKVRHENIKGPWQIPVPAV